VTTGSVPSLANNAVSEGDLAREEFLNGHYERSLSVLDGALAKAPDDAVLHELRALDLFAMQRYKKAAGTLYAVLSVGPGWDWTTMISLYPDVDVYTQQLRALESYVRENPQSPDGHFVLAYHYMTAGHDQAAARQFQQVVQLSPNDQISRQILAMITPSSASSPSDAKNAPTAETTEPPRTAPANLNGNWNSPTTGGGTINLSLAGDGGFKWTYARPDKSQSFDGKYELAGTTLVLDYGNGGTMVGKVNAEGPDRFSFKIVGAPQNDQGLMFSK
jgi:tetratricopeptide (TPR) repeat protein